MKECERCGRRFFPRSNRQRFCRPECRFARRPGVQPIVFGVRLCAGCGNGFAATAELQKFCSPGCRYRARRRDEAELYGRDHQHSRVRWAPLVAGGSVRCARGAACRFAVNGLGGFIVRGQRWDLGHADGESAGGPEHAVCNRGAPSRRRKRGR